MKWSTSQTVPIEDIPTTNDKNINITGSTTKPREALDKSSTAEVEDKTKSGLNLSSIFKPFKKTHTPAQSQTTSLPTSSVEIGFTLFHGASERLVESFCKEFVRFAWRGAEQEIRSARGDDEEFSNSVRVMVPSEASQGIF